MAVQGISARDFFDLARWSWQVYENIKASRSNFSNLGTDVECLLISVGSLDKGYTHQLVQEYIDDADEDSPRIHHHGLQGMTSRQVEVMALRDGLNSVIVPFLAVFEKHQPSFGKSGKPKKPPRDDLHAQSSDPQRPLDKSPFSKFVVGPTTMPEPPKSEDWLVKRMPLWVRRTMAAFELKDLNELRSRFAVQAANLNLFMTRLTHLQIQRQTTLLTLRLTEQSLLGDNWTYSQNLVEGKARFRADVASYVQYLLDGGPALSQSSMHQRLNEHKRQSRPVTNHSEVSGRIRKSDLQHLTAPLTKQRYESEQYGFQDVVEVEDLVNPRALSGLANLSKERDVLWYEIIECIQGMERAEGTTRVENQTRFAELERDLVRNEVQRAKLMDDAKGNTETSERAQTREKKAKLKIMSEIRDVKTNAKANINPGKSRREMELKEALAVRESMQQRTNEMREKVEKACYDSHDLEYVMAQPKSESALEVMRNRSRSRSRNRSRNRKADVILQTARKRLARAEQQGLLEGSDGEDQSELSDWSEQPSSEQSPEPYPSPRETHVIREETHSSRLGLTTDKVLSHDVEASVGRKRNKSAILVCDDCDVRIKANEEYFTCSTGLCTLEEDGGSFDLCGSCFDDGHRCRGRIRGRCPPMKSQRQMMGRSSDDAPEIGVRGRVQQ